jgi:hypothetical protein
MSVANTSFDGVAVDTIEVKRRLMLLAIAIVSDNSSSHCISKEK